MESRRMTTRSSRRAAAVPVSPIKQAVTANIVQCVAKSTVKRSSRKVLVDKTNVTPVAKSVPVKASKKTVAATARTPPIEANDVVVSPFLNLQTFELQPATPVGVLGEDLLRSVVHSNLTIIHTPNGPVMQSPEAKTPQFGVPAAPPPVAGMTDDWEEVTLDDSTSPQQEEVVDINPPQLGVPTLHFPVQDATKEREEVGVDVEVSPSPHQGEVVDAKPPGLEASPAKEAPPLSERLESAWVGCDVDEVPEIGEDDDSDCSVVVNVSSPGMHLLASPAPATSLHPSTPRSADFKWQRRDQLSVKVKEQQRGSETFSYYGGGEEYEDCDEYEGSEDYGGQVIDCEEICQGISRMGVADSGLPEHKGRHIRFNYNSDDEMEVEHVEVTRLRGVPSPRGRHLRFPEDMRTGFIVTD